MHLVDDNQGFQSLFQSLVENKSSLRPTPTNNTNPVTLVLLLGGLPGAGKSTVADKSSFSVRCTCRRATLCRLVASPTLLVLPLSVFQVLFGPDEETKQKGKICGSKLLNTNRQIPTERPDHYDIELCHTKPRSRR